MIIDSNRVYFAEVQGCGFQEAILGWISPMSPKWTIDRPKSKYPPAKPGALRLLAPQRGLTAIEKEQENPGPMDRTGIALSPQVRIHDRNAYSRKCQTLGVPRQSRGFTHDY